MCGGITSDKALKIIRGLQGINLVGMDVVEVAPAYDHADITALAAATIATDLLHLWAIQKTIISYVLTCFALLKNNAKQADLSAITRYSYLNLPKFSSLSYFMTSFVIQKKLLNPNNVMAKYCYLVNLSCYQFRHLFLKIIISEKKTY